MKTVAFLLSACLLGGTMAVLQGCSTAPETRTGKANLHDDTVSTLNKFKRQDPGLAALLDRSDGYAMFPDIGKGGLIVGGAYGHGEVYEHHRLVGYANMEQGSVGAQIGGQEYSELIVFETPEALHRFMSGNFTFGANATAVALKAGAAAATQFKEGTAVFTMSRGGLMAEASISGQKFNYVSLNDAATRPSQD